MGEKMHNWVFQVVDQIQNWGLEIGYGEIGQNWLVQAGISWIMLKYAGIRWNKLEQTGNAGKDWNWL